MDDINEKVLADSAWYVGDSRSRALAELRRLEWTGELSPETLAAFEASAEFVSYQPGSVLVEYDAVQTHVYFVITGRLRTELFDTLGRTIAENAFVRGTVVGLFGIAMSERSLVKVVAVEPTTAFRLTLPTILEIGRNHADFQLAVLRFGAGIIKQVAMVDRSLPKPAVVGIVHHSDASRLLTQKLVSRLHQLDERLYVAGDDLNFRPVEEIPFRLVVLDGKPIDDVEKERILKAWRAQGRLFIDVRIRQNVEPFIKLLNYADDVLWCIQPQDASLWLLRLPESDCYQSAPWVRDKLHIVWLLNAGDEVVPYVPELLAITQRDFKISFETPRPTRGSLVAKGFERIVHYLRGVQIGLALGGGAARGMAHLGVLKALESNGIYVDRIAGTSAGAMTGMVYASGIDPAHATQCFKNDLQPSWFFRQIPGGGYWYLVYKYRFNLFDPMLRKYLHDYRIEQLPVPISAISVDLVEGVPMVRETGDATHSILESINLPPLSLPIFKTGQALVDGGLLKNVPADVLVSHGCNFVIASTVTAKLEKEFMGIRKFGQARLSRFFSTIQVIMRQNMIQWNNMNAIGVQPADFVIAPNMTQFEISEFTRADEMANIGEETTNESIAELRKLLARLDPKKLFPLDNSVKYFFAGIRNWLCFALRNAAANQVQKPCYAAHLRPNQLLSIQLLGSSWTPILGIFIRSTIQGLWRLHIPHSPFPKTPTTESVQPTYRGVSLRRLLVSFAWPRISSAKTLVASNARQK